MKCKLLVAEDELIERKVLCRTLQKYLGDLICLYEAKNGREALEIFAREAPQVAVLDIEMPGLPDTSARSGTALCARSIHPLPPAICTSRERLLLFFRLLRLRELKPHHSTAVCAAVYLHFTARIQHPDAAGNIA